MKKKFKICAFVFSLCLCLGLGSVQASTYYSNYRFSRGVGNMYYYVDSSASSYTSYINSAIDNWVDTGYGWNPIYLNPVASSYATAMDFYLLTQSQAVARWGASDYKTKFSETTYYLTDGRNVDFNSSNWFYTEIRLNKYSLDSIAETGYRTSEIKHEIGHALGLYHRNGVYDSIMCDLVYGGRTTTVVDRTSHNCINEMYN